MAKGGNENSNRRMLVGEAQLPFHTIGLGQRPERRGNLTGRDREVIELPFDPGKEVVSLEIDVMVGVKNVATIARDEIGDAAHQTFAVGTLHQQGGSSRRRLAVARHYSVFGALNRVQPG